MPISATSLNENPGGASQRGGRLLPSGNTLPFLLVTALFFLWGVPNNLNDVLIRQFMKAFELSRFQAGLVQSAFYLGYFVLAIPAGLLMRKFGYKAGLVLGLFLFSAGCFLFWPAALIQSYASFLLALFIIASGLAFLETGASPFMAQIGDPASSERRLNFCQAFNPLGSIVGVLIGTTFIFSGVELTPFQISTLRSVGRYNDYLKHETLRVIVPYLVLGGVVLLWALFLIRTKFPVIDEPSAADSDKGKFQHLLKYPHFLQAVVAQFTYVGAQVGTWSFFIQYIQDYVHLGEKQAGLLLTGTLAAFAAGRWVATYLMSYVRPNLLMGIYSFVNIGLVAIGVFHPGWIGVWSLFATSFFMSLMFPTIFALGLKGLGPNTKLGGSLIVMAIIGGAVFTPLMGAVYGMTASMAKAMIVPLFCYVFIAYFSLVGSRIVPVRT